ncbi:DLG5 protein, partial [Polyodon spathula]|nr:DLG5 protein [Polyodon spathula]
MDPKHKELLGQCHQNLLQSITNADRVIELLGKAGTLSQLERHELDNNCSSSSEKTDLLLKILTNKERDHFPDLCVALEKTHPHLCSALFVNGVGPMDNSSGKLFVNKYYL